MEQANIKLFSLLLRSTGSKLLPKFYSDIRRIALRCSMSSQSNSWGLDSDDERKDRNFRYSKDSMEDEDFDDIPRYSSNNRRNQHRDNFQRNDRYNVDRSSDWNDMDDGDFDTPRYSSNSRSNHFNDYRGGRNNFQRNDRYSMNRSSFQRVDKFEMAGGRLTKPNWETMELEPFQKNFYTPSDKVLGRSDEEIVNFRNTHKLSLLGNDIPNPILEFSDHEFPQEVKDTFLQNKYETPTPIQAQGWPIALSGKDFIGIGQTGSGKTLGFTVPGLIHIKNQPEVKESDGPIGLVLAPTRELAQQIHETSADMFSSSRLRTACLYGGAGKGDQFNILKRRPSFCIATPGRLLDFLEMGATNLHRCSYLVLDEADRMLDMGFEPQIRKIVDQIRPDRQTLMWSATWPKEVEQLSRDFLSSFIRLNVGSLELYANPDIEQVIEVCSAYEKLESFMRQIKDLSKTHKKILVFAQTKRCVDSLCDTLYRAGIKARGIHGDHKQMRRTNTLENFRTGRFPILVATDVAARGLDVNDISLVVNFDFPPCIEDYVHRIGRTARAGKAGTALSYVTHRDNADAIKSLMKLLKKGNMEVPAELFQILEKNMDSKYSKKKRW